MVSTGIHHSGKCFTLILFCCIKSFLCHLFIHIANYVLNLLSLFTYFIYVVLQILLSLFIVRVRKVSPTKASVGIFC